MSTEHSGFSFYSIAVVTADKPPNVDEIQCYLAEKFPGINGVISEYTRELTSKTTNINGAPQQQKSTGVAVITAKWMPLGATSQYSAPNVKANETVIVFRYGDTLDFFWDKVGREPVIRGLEDVIYVWGGTNKFNEMLTDANSYWVRVNTIDKFVRLHTSKSNGEKFEYDIEIDTGKGILIIKDSAGNTIILNSQEGTFNVKANKKINLEAPEINLKGNVNNTGNVTTTGDNIVSGTVTGNQVAGTNGVSSFGNLLGKN